MRTGHKLLSAHPFPEEQNSAATLATGPKRQKVAVLRPIRRHRFSCRRPARMVGPSFSRKVPTMPTNDDFEPRLGRLGDKGRKPRPRKFLSRVITAANLARGGAPGRARQSAFTGSRIGRGAGVGRVLSARDRYAAFRQRRVIVNFRAVNIGGHGFKGAKAHLPYVERDGTTPERKCK